MKAAVFFVVFCLFSTGVRAQINISVPLDNPIYSYLEAAQLRAVIAPLPSAKPYPRSAVLRAISEIESAYIDGGKNSFSKTEIDAIRVIKEKIDVKPAGLKLQKLSYVINTKTKNNIQLRAEAAFKMDSRFSFANYISDYEDNFSPAWEYHADFTAAGDLANNLSIGFTIGGGFFTAERREAGMYNKFYPGYKNDEASVMVKTYFEPDAFFPFDYRPRWDGYVWSLAHVNNSDMLSWPSGASTGFFTRAETAFSMFDGILFMRLGRFEREYAGLSHGYSLLLNKNAQPFFGFDIYFSPFNFVTVSNVTGILEYYAENGIKDSAFVFQNAFSLSHVELNYKSYLFFSFGSAVVWPKRFELAYLFPLIDKLLYQDNIGDFDNVGEFVNLKLQLPGIGNIWGSFFLDEINNEKDVFALDRAIFSFQGGTQIVIPPLPFGTFTLSYTKIEPYCYTHPLVEVPWYKEPVTESFINHGEPLGYNLKPNSDEIKALLRFSPRYNLALGFQYQLVRHGADYGSSAVDGSSYTSELLPEGRSDNPALRKSFLKDGAYQWTQIARVNCDLSFEAAGIPVTLFAGAGVVFSHWTNIEGKANSGESLPYSPVNTEEYPEKTGVIISFGIKLFY